MKIYGDLLLVLRSEYGAEKIVLTQVQVRVKVPYDRLKMYIAELVDLGLIQDETFLQLTVKGVQYLREYKRILDFMKRMGLSYR